MQAGDEVFFVAAAGDIREVMAEMRQMDRPVQRVIIAGGGNIGLRLARALEDKLNVKVIESSKRRCEYLVGTARLDAGAQRRREQRGPARRRERGRDRPLRLRHQRRRGEHHVGAARQADGRAPRDRAHQPPGLRRPHAGRPDRHRHLAGAGHARQPPRARAARRRGGRPQRAARPRRGARAHRARRSQDLARGGPPRSARSTCRRGPPSWGSSAATRPSSPRTTGT